jgi:hypothetical protein
MTGNVVIRPRATAWMPSAGAAALRNTTAIFVGAVAETGAVSSITILSRQHEEGLLLDSRN